MVMTRFGVFILWFFITCAVGYGWVLNIIDLIHMHDGITGLLVARVVGIFMVPLGAVLGIWG